MKDKTKYYIIIPPTNNILFYKNENGINYAISTNMKVEELKPNFVNWSRFLKSKFVKEIEPQEAALL